MHLQKEMVQMGRKRDEGQRCNNMLSKICPDSWYNLEARWEGAPKCTVSTTQNELQ